MGEGFSNPIIGGGGALVYPSIHSPGYQAGVTGWTINKDGSAEFNNLTLRGTFKGSNYEININGAFFYSGTPALGNLIGSNTNAPGTDSHGNAYLAGDVQYSTVSGQRLAIQTEADTIRAWTAPTAAGPWTVSSGVINFGLQSYGINLALSGDTVSINGPIPTPLVTVDPVALLGNPETWHTLGALGATGWSGDHGRYRMTVDNEVEFDILFHSTTASSGGFSRTYANTLPAAYRPAFYRSYPLGYDGTQPSSGREARLTIDTSGNVTASASPVTVSGLAVGGNIRMPLD